MTLAQLETPVLATQLLPELLLVIAGCAALLAGLARRGALRRLPPMLALSAVAAAYAAMWWQSRSGEWGAIGGGLTVDGLAALTRAAAMILGVLLILANWSQPSADEQGEFFAMLLFSLAGLMLTALADNLVLLFLALELVSIPTYVMVTLSRRGPRCVEAGTKYFYLGALAAAILAFGLSYLYGASGTASLSRSLAAAFESRSEVFAFASIGVVLTLAGLMFKIAAVPLHFYLADVYQGAAPPVAGFLGFVPKLAGFVAIMRVVGFAGGAPLEPLFWTLWIVAAASMTVGNVLALLQTSLPRLLAYSGVAHSGYMLVGVLAGPGAGEAGGLRDGYAAVLYYVLVYGIANLAAFALLALLRVRDGPAETLRDLAGLLRRHPSLALLMALAMLTLMGLPPTPGFWGKLALFSSALTAATEAPLNASPADHGRWLVALVIIAVVNTAIAAAYYLRVAAAVLLYESDRPATAAPLEATRIGAVACGFLLLVFTFAPQILLTVGRSATSDFRADLIAADAGPSPPADGARPVASTPLDAGPAPAPGGAHPVNPPAQPGQLPPQRSAGATRPG